tara:strand:- start:199 stop:768 length:570 start_codon:yes stop_codon:yes gene_type:complete
LDAFWNLKRLMSIVNKIIKNFKNNKELYIGEKVTISQHMIQTAMIAEKNNSSKALVCACLLHDYGHFIVDDPDLLVLKSLDGKHEKLGYEFLKKYFISQVIEPIKLHVDAKRYLCRNNFYYEHLSEASKISLDLQGGIMNEDEAKKFSLLKHFKDAIKVREYDDDGKVPNIKMKKIDDYKELISSQLIL